MVIKDAKIVDKPYVIPVVVVEDVLGKPVTSRERLLDDCLRHSMKHLPTCGCFFHKEHNNLLGRDR